MSFMRPMPFGKLSPSDTFSDGIREWIKFRHEGSELNAMRADGTYVGSFPDDRLVDPIRIKTHILDLRSGDIVQTPRSLGISYETMTVLQRRENQGINKDTLVITFARPMLNADSFGTTCPSWNVHVEKFDALVTQGNYKRADFYYLIGVDTSAIYDSYKFYFDADQFRLAVFLRSLPGEKREMATLLCLPYPKIREEVVTQIYERIKHREEVPPFPDRDDTAEAVYERNLRERCSSREQLSTEKLQYLRLCEARKTPSYSL